MALYAKAAKTAKVQGRSSGMPLQDCRKVTAESWRMHSNSADYTKNHSNELDGLADQCRACA